MYELSPENFSKLRTSSRKLMGDDPDPCVVALPMLHFRNAHPVSVAQFDGFFSQRSAGMDPYVAAFKAITQAGMSLTRRENDHFGDELPSKADVLFVSHYVNRSQARAPHDNYFGGIPDALQNAGYSTVVAQINHTWDRQKDVTPIWQSGNVPRVILARTGTLRQELGFLKGLAEASNVIFGRAKNSGNRMTLDLARFVHQNRYHSAGSFGLRTAGQVARLVARLKPRVLVTTFEGHVWERLVFRAAREVSPDLICAGYHHTVLFPQQQALETRIGHGYDPDRVLTAGSVSRDWFKEQQDWTGTPVSSIGSTRSQEKTTEEPKAGNTCLVAPEGILSESAFLFETAVEAASLSPGFEFRLRLHPVISQDDLLTFSPSLKVLPENVRWSTGSLDEALGEASDVLYRGSTVSLSAAIAGLRPIYLELPEERFSLNPLEKAGPWSVNVGSALELVTALKQGTPHDKSEFSKAMTYCQQYFEPLSSERFLKAVGLKSENT